MGDKVFVSPLLERAGQIFATALEAAGEDCEMAILISRQGGIQFAPAAGCALESLRLERGAESAYRVERRCGRVRVEASTARERCLLEAQPPPQTSSVQFPLLLVTAPRLS